MHQQRIYCRMATIARLTMHQIVGRLIIKRTLSTIKVTIPNHGSTVLWISASRSRRERRSMVEAGGRLLLIIMASRRRSSRMSFRISSCTSQTHLRVSVEPSLKRGSLLLVLRPRSTWILSRVWARGTPRKTREKMGESIRIVGTITTCNQVRRCPSIRLLGLFHLRYLVILPCFRIPSWEACHPPPPWWWQPREAVEASITWSAISSLSTSKWPLRSSMQRKWRELMNRVTKL